MARLLALVRHIATIGGMTMVSRVLGFIRDMLIAAMLGAGARGRRLLRRLQTAQPVPQPVRRGRLQRGLRAAVRRTRSQREGPAAGPRLRRARPSRSCCGRCWPSPCWSRSPCRWCMHGAGAGLRRRAEQLRPGRRAHPHHLSVPAVRLAGLAAWPGVLNSLDRFAAAAATPILLNLCMIAAATAAGALDPTPGARPGLGR